MQREKHFGSLLAGRPRRQGLRSIDISETEENSGLVLLSGAQGFGVATLPMRAIRGLMGSESSSIHASPEVASSVG